MKAYFSKRQADALWNKKLPVTFPKPLRVSIARILKQFSDWGGWNDNENFTFDSATTALLTFYGKEQLEAFDQADNRVSTDFEGFVKG